MSISLADLERSLSLARLSPYRRAAADDREAIGLYLWNMDLSQALQPSLHAIEVAFRNSIHAAGSAQFGAFDWFRDPAHLNLLSRERRMLDGAVDQLWQAGGHDVRRIRQGRLPAPPLPGVDDHIAALTFGFWVALLNAPYRRELWSAADGRRNLLPVVFPRAGRPNRQQHLLYPRFDRIRRLRNRVSHHEPIWNWQPSLQAEHQELLQVLGWISPAMRALVALIDQFPAVHARGYQHYLAGLTLVP